MTAIYIVGIITAGVVLICLGEELGRMIIDYKLKKKQIESDMKVKIEEVYAKNKLEMDKLIADENSERTYENSFDDKLSTDDFSVKEKRGKTNIK